jgi:hypothetical protein
MLFVCGSKVNGHTLVRWTEAMRTATTFKKGRERGLES